MINVSNKIEVINLSDYLTSFSKDVPPIPDQLVIGKLPRRYDPNLYVSEAKSLFYDNSSLIVDKASDSTLHPP